MTGSYNLTIRPGYDEVGREYFHHSSGQRINTDAVIIEALRKQYPELSVVVAPAATCNLLAFAGSGHALAAPIQDTTDPVYAPIRWRQYIPPARRLDHGAGALADIVMFGKYIYNWNSHEFIVYIVNGRDGSSAYPSVVNNYILTKETISADQLIIAASKYGSELHNEVWVFDGGYWQKSGELWQSVQHSKWEDVILDAGMKKAIINDVDHFFDSRDTYTKLKVPWKRGIIYYGPPGNGKTISIKAMMHSLYQRKEAIPTLYVRTLASFAGPEYSINQIFGKARQEAPCYLVFEDLDSIVSDSVRSYFLNEVDGLKSNDGILMVGSTNHLDRLDPAISKRPSRFDRKYYFPDPNFDQRVAYCHYWQHKLSDNPDIEFPDKLCIAIANITDKFSFAYMQEAFVAALLAIAASQNSVDADLYVGPAKSANLTSRMAADPLSGEDPDLDDLILWQEIRKQIKILREEMDEKSVKHAK
ncbi:P-loop containing nucleoside triphosphate hydrolase protein [Lepidopterella palustris CBS 459.81]|uniref:P-loop containing nucleoside triphosphate hydrolase protein n=1 Tax=Lepidopterella palustris CBS 459.81 TaxID=1314670 RepID=A0A8E2JH96_9PEZI|nr:P-loop containing nucleoside triphosphate hydrolase protein [Lepidopterella palustris CBS 459.81]